jgi:hypothetical protein
MGGASPMCTAASAIETWCARRSGVEYTAVERILRSRQVCMIRTAGTPRLATRMFLIFGSGMIPSSSPVRGNSSPALAGIFSGAGGFVKL